MSDESIIRIIVYTLAESGYRYDIIQNTHTCTPAHYIADHLATTLFSYLHRKPE